MFLPLICVAWGFVLLGWSARTHGRNSAALLAWALAVIAAGYAVALGPWKI